MEVVEEVIAEGFRPVQPFDPGILLRQILLHRATFERELQGPSDVPDEFAIIRGQIYYHINFRRQSGVNVEDIRELSTLLPDMASGGTDPIPIVHACDLIDNRKSIDVKLPLDPSSEHLRTLNTQIKRLFRITEELNDDPILFPLLQKLTQYYKNYRDALCREGSDIAEMLKPVPFFCGLGIGYSQLSRSEALRMLCRKPNGQMIERENLYGEHLITKMRNKAFKPKLPRREFEFGYALAATNAYQLFNRRYRVATPAALIVVGHVECELEGEPSGALQSLLEYSHQTPCLRNVVQVTEYSEGFLSDDMLQLEQAFQSWKAQHGDEKLLKLLNNLNEPSNISELQATAGIDREKIEQIPKYLKSLPSFIKDFSWEKALDIVPRYRSKRDGYSLCAKVVVDILITATDMKASNTNECTVTDPSGDGQVFYEEGFDVDRAFTIHITKTVSGHHLNVKSQDLFDDLNIPFNLDLKKEMLEFPAIFFWLTLMRVTYQDDCRFKRLIEQMVFKDRDRFENDYSALGMPAEFIPGITNRMQRMLIRMQEILPGINTLEEFVNIIMPFFIEYRNILLEKHKGNVLEAYLEHHRGASVESVYEYAQKPCPDLSRYKETERANDKRTMSSEQAIAEGILQYRHNGTLEEHFQYLQYVAESFPFVNKTSYTQDELDRLLLNFHRAMFFNALELLARCRANFGAAEKGETVLHRVLGRAHLDKIFESRRVIDFLLKQEGIDPRAVCARGLTSFMVFVRSAKDYSVDFIHFVIELFVQKGVDINQEVNEKTALDVAVELGSLNLFVALVGQRGCQCTSYKTVVEFLQQHQTDDRAIAAVRTMSVIDPYFGFLWALRRISRSKKEGHYSVSIEGDHKEQFYLHDSIAAQIFDDEGNVTNASAQIQIEGELLFYVLSESSYSRTELLSSRFHQVCRSYGVYADVFKCRNKNGGEYKIYLVRASEGKLLTQRLARPDLKKSLLEEIDGYSLLKLIYVTVQLGIYLSPESILVSPCQFQDKLRYILRSLPLAESAMPNHVDEVDVQKLLFPFQALRSVRVDTQAITEIIKVDSRQLLKAWKEVLFTHECRLVNLSLQSNRARAPSIGEQQGIQLYSGDMAKYFYRHEGILDILRGIKNPDYTVGDFLDSAASLFGASSKQEQVVTPRQNSKVSASKIKGALTKLTSPRVKEVTSVVSSGPVTLRRIRLVEAGNELEQLGGDERMLGKATAEIQKGVFTSFFKLSAPYLKQRAVQSVDWTKLPTNSNVGAAILEEAAKIPLTELVAVNCSFFTEQNTAAILESSYGLRVFNVSGSKTLGNNLSVQLSKNCQFLGQLTLDRTLITKLPIATLPHLRELSADFCMNLEEVQVDVPAIAVLSFESSQKLTVFRLHSKSPHLVQANFNYCVSLDPKSLRHVPLLASELRDVRHLEAPEFNARGFVRNVHLDKMVDSDRAKSLAKSLVQNGLLNLFGISLSEEVLNRIVTTLSKSTSGNVLHKNQFLTALDLRGCTYPLRVIASVVVSAPGLERLLFQTQLKPKDESPIRFVPKIQHGGIKSVDMRSVRGTIRGEESSIEKMMQLPNGLFIFFFSDASYRVWDIKDKGVLKFVRKGSVGKIFYNADILPNNDIIVCCDGAAKILNTATWGIPELLSLETDENEEYHLVKVVNKNRLVLGGKHLSIYEISGQNIIFKKSIKELSVKAMALTPNQNIFVVQSELSGTIIWRLEDCQPLEILAGDLVGDNSRPVSTIVVIDNLNVLLVDSFSGTEMNLNLRTKEITSRKLQLGINYGVLGPNADLVLGGANVNDLAVYNHQTKQSSAPYGKVLRAIFAQVQGKMGEPCLTDRGDLLVSVDKTAWLIRNEYHDIDLKFVVGLPVNLSIKLTRSDGQTAEIQITLPVNVTLLEKNAILTLRSFINNMFGLSPFIVKDEDFTILIAGIPVEDAYSYQMMFESFVSRAKEFQTKTLPAAQKQLSPRRPNTQFFSSQSNIHLHGGEDSVAGRSGPSMSLGGAEEDK